MFTLPEHRLSAQSLTGIAVQLRCDIPPTCALRAIARLALLKKTKKEGKKQVRGRFGFFFLTVGNYRLIRAVGWEKITMSSEVGEVYSG